MKVRRIIHIIVRIILILILFCLVLLGYSYIRSRILIVSHYDIEADIEHEVRIVQISDLHNAVFGDQNQNLIQRITEQEPDIIVMTGDMLNRNDDNTQIVSDLITDLCQIAPVYFGYGNHEATWERNWGKDLHEIFSRAGATVLECEYEDIIVNEQPLRIGGYMAYWGVPHMMTNDSGKQEDEKAFFEDFVDTDLYTILLNHIPTQWVDWDYIDHSSVDLVFCGHYHGGAVRIPIIEQGLYAPYVGWFPPNTKGCFEGKDTTCVLSTGLGSEHSIPRLNNPPEIVVADLVPRK